MSTTKKQVPAFRRMFTAEEDELIKRLFEEEGIRNWAEIAEKIEDRTPKQCKDRYNNYLSPGIKNLPWTQEEDQRLLQKIQEFGHKWTKIVQFFPGRGSNNIKNRWHKVLSKEFQSNESSEKKEHESSPETYSDNAQSFHRFNEQPALIVLDEQQNPSFDVVNFAFEDFGEELVWEIE